MNGSILAEETKTSTHRRSARLRRCWAVILSLCTTAVFSGPIAAQEQRGGEVAATLSVGRVVFCVTKTGILVAAARGTGEKGSHPPAVVAVGSRRVGVLLGAAEWNTGGNTKPMRLDAELPVVAANATRRNGEKNIDEPHEIEEIGIGVLETLRPLVTQIHGKLDVTADEPLVELLLADYVEDYGPEIWSLQFRIRQENLGNGYWETLVLRPAYHQLYPPEKGQPRTFVEVQYPPSANQSGLLDRFARHDAQIERIRNGSPEQSKATDAILSGNSDKAAEAPIADFLRGAVPVVTGSQAPIVMALLDATRGFQWLMPPQEAPPPPAETKPAEPGAPSLRKYTPR
jgi:hypothetical protein